MSSAASHHHAPDRPDIPCPDPSVHAKHDRLSAQASTAALYVTQPHKGTDPRQPKEDVLGKDGKLSSKSAATSLKYAKQTELPSFPSHGGHSNAAGAAAMLAKDYRMKDLWQPEQSMAGSKAAVKAQKDGGKLDLWQYEGSKNGLSAAALAMRKNTQASLSPNLDRGYTDAGKNNSLLAATKSATSSRQRADSTPVRPPPLYPDEKNSARNALSAATVSHRNSVRAPPAKKEEGWGSEANQAARIQHGHMDRDMFGSSPPVAPEVEERKREAALRASAVSMAKQMYDQQNRAVLAAAADTSSIGPAGAETAHKRNASAISQPDLKQEAMKYITLQDQAHKLAQERLAKVDKDMENNKYREYYGYGDKSPRKSRMSVRSRHRKRASSEGGADLSDSDDEQQARRIRNQMSQLSTASNTVSDKQRDEDRARLLRAAEKRVHDRMHDMDEKVFMETGKPSQAMMDDWEAKAREKAEKDRTEREKHPGKTHIGGGKYMDQSEIEAIAAARLKPTLDELNDTATKKRERDEELARQKDAQQTERMEERMRNDQQKTEFRRIREQDKAVARKEKEERKAAQREEKARKSEDKRKSRDMKRDDITTGAGTVALSGAAADHESAEETQTDLKDKRRSRGVLGRLTDKFRKDDKPTQTEKTETAATDRTTDRNEPEASGTAAAGAPVVGAIGGLGAVGSVRESDSMYDVSSRDAEGARDFGSRSDDFESTRDVRSSSIDRKGAEDEPHSNDMTYLGAAAAAATGTATAGGLAWATSRSSDPQENRGDVSSTSTDDDLQRVETAHSLQPLQSPTVEQRPDLERHISAINTSSGESDSDELSDSDDDDFDRGRRVDQGMFVASSRPEEEAAAEEPSSRIGENVALGTAAAATMGAGAYGLGRPTNDRANAESVVSPETQKYHGTLPLDGKTDRSAEPLTSGRTIDKPAHVTASATSGQDDIAVGNAQSVVSPETQRYHGTHPLDGQADRTAELPASRQTVDTPADVTATDTSDQDIIAAGNAQSVVSPETQQYHRSRLTDDTANRSGLPTPASQSADTADYSRIARAPEQHDLADREERMPVPVLDPSPKDKDDSIRLQEVAQPVVTPAAPVKTAEPAAEAPIVATGPSASDNRTPEKPKEDQDEKRGLRGLFSRLKGRDRDSKSDGKLHKARSPEQQAQTERGFQGGVKYTSPSASAGKKDEGDNTITPVTTTSAGKEAEGMATTSASTDNDSKPLPLHIGTDGPIGDPEGRASVSPISASSFQRHDATLRDPDDASSSGADEEDVQRGRAGRFARKLGLGKGEGRPSAAADREERGGKRDESEEQFEEARDTFDESLAPPAAFAGQPKGQSPVRETRFTERF